jgi:NAD(P)-dependent dehydrogenase (short-subunit alcohol dehydrogenase family)
VGRSCLIDATNPFVETSPKLVLADLGDTGASEIVAGFARGARIVKAFNSIRMVHFNNGPVAGQGKRVIFVSGDDEQSKLVVKDLIESFGFAAITKGTIIFTNASAALKGFPLSGAFAMACHAKSGLAQSMARELMPQGIHVATVPIDAAIGWTQDDGTRAHRLAGTTVDDNMADPDHIAETYLQLHHQHRSTWAFEVVLRPWVEKW